MSMNLHIDKNHHFEPEYFKQSDDRTLCLKDDLGKWRYFEITKSLRPPYELIISYDLGIDRKGKAMNGEICLQLSDSDKNTSVSRNVDELLDWAQKSPIEFNFLRKFVIDAPKIIKEWPAIKKDQLILLQSLLAFLEATPVSLPIFKKCSQKLTELYYYLSIDKYENDKDEKNKSDQVIKHKQEAIEKYLNLCYDDQNQDWFDEKENNSDANGNREKKVIKVVDELLKGDFGDNFEKKREFLLEKSKSWLLLRYNLCEASKIAFQKPRWPRWVFLLLPESLAIAVLLWSFICPTQVTTNAEKNWCVGVFYLLSIVFGIGLACSIGINKEKWKKFCNGLDKNVQILLPRVAAGIIVGYLVLLSDEAWQSIFDKALCFSDGCNIDIWLALGGRIVLPGFGVLVYIFIEIKNVTGIVVGWKPLHILVRGYSYAVLIGVIISDIFGKNMAVRAGTVNCMKGFFGVIYPEVIFYQAPLALFIGIFLQLLWDDKALTAKI